MKQNAQRILGQCEEGENAYAILNTTEYNNDGSWSVIVVPFNKLPAYGFDTAELQQIKQMSVGQQMTFDYGLDAQIVRLA